MSFQPMPIIVGSPRSGTTLLRLMLDAHPHLAIPPETGFLISGKRFNERQKDVVKTFFQTITKYPPDAPAWNDFHIPATDYYRRLLEIRPFSAPDGFRLFYKMYAERFGKSRWGDKTPLYAHHLIAIQDLLPEAYFIHIIRDGRDTAISLREQWFSPGNDIITQAQFWKENVLTAHSQGKQCHHYMEIRFEDLIQHSEHTLRQICDYIELDFDPHMISHHKNASSRLQEHLERRKADGSLLVSQSTRQNQQRSSSQPPNELKIGVWKNLLNSDEIHKFESIAGDTLQAYGYEIR